MNLKQAVLDSQEVWEKIEKGRYGSGARALDTLFKKFHANDDVDAVYAKVALLNLLYSTMIVDDECFALAKGIAELDGLDDTLQDGCHTAVERIATASGRLRPVNKGEPWEHYSFATKYCSFHYPELYPIYDSNVDGELWERRICQGRLGKRDKGFHGFKRRQLKNYKEFRHIVGVFRAYYGVERLCLRKVDRYLWLKGKKMVGVRGKATKKAKATY